MTDEQELAEKVVHKMYDNDDFSKWMGVEIIEIKPKRSVVRMKIRGEMLNGHDVCHGGIPFALADTAFAFASNTQGKIALSIDTSMSYPAKILEGDIITATAKELTSGNRIAKYDVTLTNQNDELVGLFRGTVYMLDERHFEDEN